MCPGPCPSMLHTVGTQLVLAESVNGKTGCPVTSCGFLSNTCPGKQLKLMQGSDMSGFLGFPLLKTSLCQERVGSCHLIGRPVFPLLLFFFPFPPHRHAQETELYLPGLPGAILGCSFKGRLLGLLVSQCTPFPSHFPTPPAFPINATSTGPPSNPRVRGYLKALASPPSSMWMDFGCPRLSVPPLTSPVD